MSSSLRLPSWTSPHPTSAPFVLESDQGKTLTIIGSGSIVRYLTTGEEDSGKSAFAVVQSRGRAAEVVPAHFHKNTHDVFLVTDGSVKLYVGDQVRTLHAGDFASVPPGVPHAYQIMSDSEFLGVISPGSWIKFFDFIAEEFDASPLFPSLDGRDFPVPLFIEGIKAGSDVVPLRDFDYSVANATPTSTENVLPAAVAPYYLRASTGPSYILGNQSLSPMITNSQAHEGAFSILLISGIGSSFPSYSAASSPFSSTPICLPTSFLARAVEGKITFTLEGSNPETLTAKEGIFVPSGVKFTYEIESAYARMYMFAGKGEGLEKVFEGAGRLVEGEKREVVGEKVEKVDEEKVAKVVAGLK